MKLDDLYNKKPINESNTTYMSSDIFSKAITGYQDLENDNSQNQKLNLRKTRLTLKQINKMRMMNDVRNFELKEKLAVIKQQYGPGAVSDDGDMDF